MVIKQEVAYSIIEAITDLRKGNDLEDFTVIVDGVSVRCHRFILGACSLFFRALFRSGMKEDEENCVTLKTVSHPTFTLILTALYTGCDILTEENVLDVWRAAHMLQIGFLVKECETLIEKTISVDNFDKFYETAKLLDSETILNAEHEFMTKNFDLIRASPTLLKLSFGDIKELIETDELITSTEDNVVESILQWVLYTPPQTSEHGADAEVNHVAEGLAVQNEDKDQESQLNTSERSKENRVNIMQNNKNSESNEVFNANDDLYDEGTRGPENELQNTKNQNRVQGEMTSNSEAAFQTLAPVLNQKQTSVSRAGRQKYLLSLISISRTCLLSLNYLEKLLSNPVIADNSRVRNVVLRAVFYQVQVGYRHGQWPSAAIHRSNSQFKNVLLWVVHVPADYRRDTRYRDVELHADDFFHDDEEYVLTEKASSGKITAFDNDLYELNNDGLYILRNNSWNKVIPCQLSDKTFMIPLGNRIYFLDGSTRELTSVNPKANTPVLQKDSNFPEEFTVAGADKYQERILVFSFKAEERMETVVHTFDPSNETWARLENMQGPAENIISFHNDEKTFLLQTNGNLWKVTDDGDSSFKIVYCKKAWDFHWKLYGAAIFRRRLVIFGANMPEDKDVSFSLPGSNERAWPVQVDDEVCTTPIILPSEYLVEKNDSSSESSYTSSQG